MHTGQYRFAITYIAQGQHEVLFAGGGINKNVYGQFRPWRRQLAGCNVIQLIIHSAGVGAANVIVFRHSRVSAWCKRHKENLEIQKSEGRCSTTARSEEQPSESQLLM